MTTLVVEPLKSDPLVQDMNCKKRLLVQAIRPYLYFHNLPDAQWSVVIRQNNQDLETSVLNSSDIYSQTSIANDNYAHGYINFSFTQPVTINRGDFEIKLTSQFYTFSESAYIGWIKEYENVFYGLDYTPSSDLNNPFSLQIFSLR